MFLLSSLLTSLLLNSTQLSSSHKVCDLARKHAYYENDKERCLAAGKIWRDANKEKYIEYRAKYAANKLNCECGHYTSITKNRHLQSKRHCLFINEK